MKLFRDPTPYEEWLAEEQWKELMSSIKAEWRWRWKAGVAFLVFLVFYNACPDVAWF